MGCWWRRIICLEFDFATLFHGFLFDECRHLLQLLFSHCVNAGSGERKPWGEDGELYLRHLNITLA